MDFIIGAASLVFVVAAPAGVLFVLGRWIIPERERTPFHALGWRGWRWTIARGNDLLVPTVPPPGTGPRPR